MTAYGDMGTMQGIRALENGVAIGGKIRVYVGSGTPLATFSATEIGDLYLDYTNAILYIASAIGTGSWTAYASGIKWKEPVRVATTTDGTLATAYANGESVDGITLVTGDRILLKNQTDQKVNGIYTVNATGAPTRAMDSDTGAEILGAVVAVLEGTVNEDSAWVNTNSTTITIGSSNITFAIFGGIKAGNGLAFTADVLAIDTAITCDLTTSQAITNKSKVAITSQSAAYNDSALQVGKYGTPIADTVLDDNILASIVNSSGVNKTAGADKSSMALYVGNATTAAVTNNKMQCILSSMNIGHNMYDAYAVQGHMAVTNNCGTQNANAHVTGISGKFSVTNGKTLATGWGTAILGIIEGAGAVTQMCHVVSAVCEAGVTACQSLYHAYTDSTINAAFQINGAVNMTHLFDFDAQAGCVGANDIHIDIASAAGYIPYASSAAQFVTLTGAQALTNKTQIDVTSWSSTYTNSALNVGKYGAPLVDATSTDNILVSFNSSTGTNKGGADRSSMVLFVGNATTGAVTNNKMQGVLSSMTVGHNVFDAYAGQFHINVSATMATQAGTANLVGLAAKASIKNGATATGYVSSLYILGGDTDSGSLTGTATSGFDLVRMENAQVGCNSAIKFIGDANIAYLFDMDVAGCVSTSSGAVPNATHKIKVNMGGVTGYIHVGAS